MVSRPVSRELPAQRRWAVRVESLDAKAVRRDGAQSTRCRHRTPIRTGPKLLFRGLGALPQPRQKRAVGEVLRESGERAAGFVATTRIRE
jgi:hypothetical protein